MREERERVRGVGETARREGGTVRVEEWEKGGSDKRKSGRRGRDRVRKETEESGKRGRAE